MPNPTASSQSHGNLQSSAYRTNRYLTITNNSNGSSGGLAGNGGSGNALTNMDGTAQTSVLSKDAKNFHKSLRKPPKGIFLNYEELIELLQTNNKKIFNQLTRRVDSLKKQVVLSVLSVTVINSLRLTLKNKGTNK